MDSVSQHGLIAPKVSVVVPAHNEQALLRDCLAELTAGIDPVQLEVIVVANGCTDATAQVAREFGPPVRVVETPVGNKSHALNLGDAHSQVFPRIYVDADVRLTGRAVMRLAEAVRGDQPLIAGATIDIDASQSTWPVRAYFEVWRRLPYARQRLVGAGVYAMNQAARRQIGQFPDLLSEDEFVRRSFVYEQRRTIEDCTFTVRAPRTLRALIRLRARWTRGNRQLDDRFGTTLPTQRRNYLRSFASLLGSPKLWPAMGVYLFVWVAGRVSATWQRRTRSNPWTWDRDETTRNNQTAEVRQ